VSSPLLQQLPDGRLERSWMEEMDALGLGGGLVRIREELLQDGAGAEEHRTGAWGGSGGVLLCEDESLCVESRLAN
jgi:hypothetical protein